MSAQPFTRDALNRVFKAKGCIRTGATRWHRACIRVASGGRRRPLALFDRNGGLVTAPPTDSRFVTGTGRAIEVTVRRTDMNITFPALTHAFDRFAKAAARFSGRPAAFTLAAGTVAAWVITGPIFGFSDSWQLVINTATTVVTFLMVFLIQNTQSRDTEAMQIKLDELIRVTEAASNALLDLEELDERTLDEYRAGYEALARQSRALVAARTAGRAAEPGAAGE